MEVRSAIPTDRLGARIDRSLAGSDERWLENQPQTELDMPRPARTEHSVARIRSRVGVAEFSGYASGWITTGISDSGIARQVPC
jgi:hypothetical protein